MTPESPPLSPFEKTIITLVGALLLGLQVWSAFYKVSDPDETTFVHITWLIHNGFRPYQDFFEHHSPVAPFLLSPLYNLFSDSFYIIFAHRMVALAISFICILLAYKVASFHFGKRIAILGLFGVCAIWRFRMVCLEFRPDLFMVMFLLISYWVALKNEENRISLDFVAGMMSGISLVALQKAVVGILGIGLIYLIRLLSSRKTKREILASVLSILSFGLGFLAVCAGFVFALHMSGLLDGFYAWGIRYNFIISRFHPEAYSIFRECREIATFEPIALPLLVVGLARLLVSKGKELLPWSIVTILQVVFLLLSRVAFKHNFLFLYFLLVPVLGIAVDYLVSTFARSFRKEVLVGSIFVIYVASGVIRQVSQPNNSEQKDYLEKIWQVVPKEASVFAPIPNRSAIYRKDGSFVWYNHWQVFKGMVDGRWDLIPDYLEEIKKSPPDFIFLQETCYRSQPCYYRQEELFEWVKATYRKTEVDNLYQKATEMEEHFERKGRHTL